MTVTVINQPSKTTARTNWIVGWLMSLTRPAVTKFSQTPYPHDAIQSKPGSFERTFDVSVNRLEPDDTPDSLEHKRHWAPIYIKRNAAKSRRVIIYYHGGGFLHEMIGTQWNMMGRMARDLDADVVIQTYILTPHGGIHENIDGLVLSYTQVQKTANSKGQEVLIGGDSAGGMITAAVLVALNDKKLPLPDQAFMIAPCLDVDIDTPESRAIEPVDVILTVDRFSAAMKAWAVGPTDEATLSKPAPLATAEEKMKMEHPYASPIRADWTFAAKAKLPITLLIGTHDLLLPWNDEFVEQARALDLELTYIRADGAAHDYPLFCDLPFASYLAPDSIEGMRLMVESIKRYSKLE